jgi:4-amino-4-deoxy-L-arabinose transferase-like glycosyltransferase
MARHHNIDLEHRTEVNLPGTMTIRQHTVIAAVLLIIGAYVIRMSAVEIQPSPEGFIAHAGKSMHEQGLTADVAPSSPGGLTTGLMPPGVPALIAVGMRVIGETQFAVRWLSVVSIGLSLLLVYAISQRFLTHQGAMQAVIIAGISIPWMTYGRQANLDVAGLPLLLGGLLMMIRMAESKYRSLVVLYAVGYIAICAICGWVSTASCVTLMLLSAGYTLLARRTVLVVVGAVGLLAALPWLMVMFATYGDQVLLASSIDVPASEPMIFTSGPLDAVLLLVASCSPLAVAIYWCISVVVRRTLIPRERETIVGLVALWFVISIIGLALDADRGFHALIHIVPAAAMISVYAMETFRAQSTPNLLLGALLTLLVSTLTVLGMYAAAGAGLQRIVFVAAMLALLVVVVVQRLRFGGLRHPVQLASGLYKPVYYGAIASGALVAFCFVVLGSPIVLQGARSVAYELQERRPFDDTFTYVYHRHHPTDGMNAQLDWYTRGWMSGQIPGHTYQSVPLPSSGADEAVLSTVIGSARIVYFHPHRDRQFRESLRTALAPYYEESVLSKNYTLFTIR